MCVVDDWIRHVIALAGLMAEAVDKPRDFRVPSSLTSHLRKNLEECGIHSDEEMLAPVAKDGNLQGQLRHQTLLRGGAKIRAPESILGQGPFLKVLIKRRSYRMPRNIDGLNLKGGEVGCLPVLEFMG
jgi:hypothetical protein